MCVCVCLLYSFYRPVTCVCDVKSTMHGCNFLFCIFCLSSFFFFSYSFLLHVGGLLPVSSFSQPACRCLQTTWRLTVICSRFPKPTIWAKKKLTGLRSHVPARDTMAAATRLGKADTVSNTPTTITTSRLKKTCGLRTSTAMEDDILHLGITGITEALVDTRLPLVIQTSRDHPGHPRDTLKTLRCVMTLQGGPRHQEDVVTQGLEGTILQTTREILPDITMANALPDKETPIVPHVASPSSKWTCRANQVKRIHCYNCVSTVVTALT